MLNKVVAGSRRTALPGAVSFGAANPNERLEVTLILRRNATDEFQERVAAVARGYVDARLRHEEFDEHFGAAANDLAIVRNFAATRNLPVVYESAPRRTVILSGTVAQFMDVFGVTLEHFEHDNGTYRGRVGDVHLPEELSEVVTAVLGLDNRPQAKPHFRLQSPETNIIWHASGSVASYLPTKVADLYNFPAGSGEGQCVGLIELGGGYRPSDLQAYFAKAGVPNPSVTAVSIDHAANAPTGSAKGPDGEVMLDIEVAGAIAPAANIVVYFAPNTDAGFLNAITTAVHDTVNKPSVISISWGGSESTWTAQAMQSFDEAFQSAATLGITICIACGDSGSTDGVNDGANHVDFPASSTYALACGGTSIQVSGATITAETVWDDGVSGGMTGGGVSTVFPLPAWQAGLRTTSGGVAKPLTMRGVPDVSGDADPESGYLVQVDGTSITLGGTSAVAPLWAALIARINANSGVAAGYVNPKLYATPAAFNDITKGDNGGFTASANWDACTGLGSPKGAALGNLLSAS
jgi:kumamolisin